MKKLLTLLFFNIFLLFGFKSYSILVKIIATVDDYSITNVDLNNRTGMLVESGRVNKKDLENPQFMNSILNLLISEKVLNIYAKRLNITVTNKDVMNIINNSKELQRMYKIYKDSLFEQVEVELLKGEIIKRTIIQLISVTDDEINNEFTKNDKKISKEMIKSHIIERKSFEKLENVLNTIRKTVFIEVNI